MKKFASLLFYFLFALSLMSGETVTHTMLKPTKNKKAEEAYLQATEHYQSKNYEKAEEELKEALKLDPDFIDAANMLGLVYYLQFKKVESINTFEKAIKDAKRLKVSDIMLHLNIALAYESNGMIDNAIDAYNYVITTDTNNPEGYYGLAALLYSTGREIHALRFFKKAFALYIGNEPTYAAQTLCYICSSYCRIGDYNYAKICYNEIKKHSSILKEIDFEQRDMEAIENSAKAEKAAIKKAKFKFQKYGLNVNKASYLKEIDPPKKFGIPIEKAFEFKDGSGIIYYAFAKETKDSGFDAAYAFIHQTSQKLAGKEPSLADIHSSNIIQDTELKKYLKADVNVLDISVSPVASDVKNYKHFVANTIYRKGEGIIFQIILLKDDDFNLDNLVNAYTLCGF
ncbi:tetratricopeptide repeat protein [Treponema pedis]|uniref:tetratricopeptide repeat protein n=1 Tax=Treponema pedis TaxID=409322 RepID=UPI000407BE74|nr:tetratricopeptide repeat protein [Treponema pedis]